ncbi:MAG: M20/M25/M40 family metallo-hydrolase [Lachnospiraceae bacterium]|nr:M20/M25/M40 family metallo-hydrolase [Lachnospiraceae bacterium]
MKINRERLLDTFTKLVSIDSPSYGEREMCAELKARLLALGLSVEEDDTAKVSGSNCGNLIAKLPGTLDIPPVMYSCHMDTVAPAFGKRAIIHEDGLITSAGDTILGADDLAGVSGILEALQVIIEEDIPHGPIEIVFTTGEEVYGKGVNALDMSKIKAKDAYVFDLTGQTGHAARKAPTIISIRIEVKGKAAHAGFAPEQGIHAIRIASGAIAKLQFGHVDEETTANIGTIAGGAATNIVPESCVVTGEVRGYNHEKALAQTEHIIETFRREAKAAGTEIIAESEVCIKAYEIDLNSRAVQRFCKACEEMGVEPDLCETFGGSDLNVFANRGMDGLVVASAMEQCHSCKEYTTVDELCRMTQMVLTLMTMDE